jgi:glucokinase
VDSLIGIGIDVGGTKILLVAVDAAGEVLDTVQTPSPKDLNALSTTISPLLVRLVAGLGDTTSRIALGLALPGLVDVAGFLRSAPNLGAHDVGFDLESELGGPLVALFGERAALHPVALENDATAAAFAEFEIGAGRDATDVLVVSIGTGIGAGFVVGGSVVRGAHGFAGEIGHMVVDPDGPQCECGRRGCWEQVASGRALARIGSRHGVVAPKDGSSRPLRGEDVVESARRGDPLARAAIEKYAESVAVGLVNATELLDPGTIVIGGGMVTSLDVLLAPIRSAYARLGRPGQGSVPSDIVAAHLGPAAAAIGAALLAMRR